MLTSALRRPSASRVRAETRVAALLAATPRYVPHPSFADPAAAPAILAPMPGEAAFRAACAAARAPAAADPRMAHLFRRPLLTREQEAHLFRRMNYHKHLTAELLAGMDPARPRGRDLAEHARLAAAAAADRWLIAECNQRLAHSLAVKYLRPGLDLDELRSDATLSVLRAVDAFDFGRGFKFSTYATWAITKNFHRSVAADLARQGRFQTGAGEAFEGRADARGDEAAAVARAADAAAGVETLLAALDPRTRDVVRMRAGIGGPARTLDEIGLAFGITKERVRQIHLRGMADLRAAADDDLADLVN